MTIKKVLGVLLFVPLIANGAMLLASIVYPFYSWLFTGTSHWLFSNDMLAVIGLLIAVACSFPIAAFSSIFVLEL